MDVAPLKIFENQVIPTGLHDISKSFRPNLATARVFSMGTKLINFVIGFETILRNKYNQKHFE